MENSSSTSHKREKLEHEPLGTSKKSFLGKNSGYSKVQFLGFSLSTEDRRVNYMGLEDDQKDWKARVEVMQAAIEKLNQSGKINPSEKCIKIFMAPEFFFRGKSGAYDMDTASNITKSLREMVKDPKYKDWLFVFGTIVAHSKDEKALYTPFSVYNYSFIQKGNGEEKDSVIVMKERMSSLDFLRTSARDNKTVTMSNIQIPTIKKDAKPRDEEQKTNYDGQGIFEIDGIRFGVEICLDNIRDRLDNAVISSNQPIDIQLVPSCGVESSALKITQKLNDKGMVFLVDGKNDATSSLMSKFRQEVQALSTEKFVMATEKNQNSVFYGDGTLKVYPTVDLVKPKDRSL